MRVFKSRILAVLLVMAIIMVPIQVNAADEITSAEYVTMLQKLAEANADDLYYLYKMFYEVSDQNRDVMVSVWDNSWDQLDPTNTTKARYDNFSKALTSFSYLVENILKGEENWSPEEFGGKIGYPSGVFDRDAFIGKDYSVFNQGINSRNFDLNIATSGYTALDQGFYRMDILFDIYSLMLDDGGKNYYMFSTTDPWKDVVNTNGAGRDYTGTASYGTLAYNGTESTEFTEQGNEYLIDPAYTDAFILAVNDDDGVRNGIGNFGTFFNSFTSSEQSDKDAIFSYLDHYEFIYWDDETTPRRKDPDTYTLTITQSGQGVVNTEDGQVVLGEDFLVTKLLGSATYEIGPIVVDEANGWALTGIFGNVSDPVNGIYTVDMDDSDQEVEFLFEQTNPPQALPVELEITVEGLGNYTNQTLDIEKGQPFTFEDITGLDGYTFTSIGGDNGKELYLIDGDSYRLLMDGDKKIHIVFSKDEVIPDNKLPETGGLSLAMPLMAGLGMIAAGMGLRKKK